MTQTRPRLTDDLAAEVRAFADSYGEELGLRLSFSDAVQILIRRGLQSAPREKP